MWKSGPSDGLKGFNESIRYHARRGKTSPENDESLVKALSDRPFGKQAEDGDEICNHAKKIYYSLYPYW
jgi:hypothetical protein